MANEDKLKQMWNHISQCYDDWDSYEQFKTDMDDDKVRGSMFKAFSKDFNNWKNQDDFDSFFGYTKPTPNSSAVPQDKQTSSDADYSIPADKADSILNAPTQNVSGEVNPNLTENVTNREANENPRGKGLIYQSAQNTEIPNYLDDNLAKAKDAFPYADAPQTKPAESTKPTTAKPIENNPFTLNINSEDIKKNNPLFNNGLGAELNQVEKAIDNTNKTIGTFMQGNNVYDNFEKSMQANLGQAEEGKQKKYEGSAIKSAMYETFKENGGVSKQEHQVMMNPVKAAEDAYDAIDKNALSNYVYSLLGVDANQKSGVAAQVSPEDEEKLSRMFNTTATYVAQSITQNLYNKFASDNKPSLAEYMLDRSFRESLTGRIANLLLNGAKNDSELMQQVMAIVNSSTTDWDNNPYIQGAIGAGSMIVDGGLFAGIGAGAGLASKGATSYATNLIGKALSGGRAATLATGGSGWIALNPVSSFVAQTFERSLGGALTFGAYDALGEGVRQMEGGEMPAILDENGEVVKEEDVPLWQKFLRSGSLISNRGLEGMQTGAIVSLTGLPAKATENMGIIGKAIGDVAGFGATGAYFTYSEMKSLSEQGLADWSSVSDWAKVAGKKGVMLGLLKAKEFPEIKVRYTDGVKNKLVGHITEEELRAVRDVIGNEYDFTKGWEFNNTESFLKAVCDKPELYEYIMRYKDIPSSLKGKLQYAFTKKLSPYGTTYDSNGTPIAAQNPIDATYSAVIEIGEKDGEFVVVTRNEHGEVLMRINYDSEKKAKKAQEELNGIVEHNTIYGLENLSGFATNIFKPTAPGNKGNMYDKTLRDKIVSDATEIVNSRIGEGGKKRGYNLKDALAKDRDKRDETEQAIVNDYINELQKQILDYKEGRNENVDKVRESADNSGNVVAGLLGDKPVTIKGNESEGASVIATDKDGNQEMVDKNNVQVTDVAPVESVAQAVSETYDPAIGAKVGNVIYVPDGKGNWMQTPIINTVGDQFVFSYNGQNTWVSNEQIAEWQTQAEQAIQKEEELQAAKDYAQQKTDAENELPAKGQVYELNGVRGEVVDDYDSTDGTIRMQFEGESSPRYVSIEELDNAQRIDVVAEQKAKEEEQARIKAEQEAQKKANDAEAARIKKEKEDADKLAQAQAEELAYRQQLADEKEKRDKQRISARLSEVSKSDNVNEDKPFDELEAAAWAVARGFKVDTESLKKYIGLDKIFKEGLAAFTKNGGMTIDQVAHIAWENMGSPENVDPGTIRDHIIDFLLSGGKRSALEHLEKKAGIGTYDERNSPMLEYEMKKAEEDKLQRENAERDLQNEIQDSTLKDLEQNLSREKENAIFAENGNEKVKKTAPTLPDGKGSKAQNKHIATISDAVSKGAVENDNDAIDVANAIVQFESNVASGGVTSDEANNTIAKAKELLANSGYEINESQSMVGKPYNEGMRINADFVEDSSLPSGTRVISVVRKASVLKNGEVIQKAEVVVKQNLASAPKESPFKVGDVVTYQPKGSEKAVQVTVEGINSDGTLKVGGEYNYMHHSWTNVSPDEVTLPASTDITKAKERYKNNFAAGLQKYLDKGMFTIADANKAIQQREKAIERIEERIKAGNPEPADLENFAKCQGEIEALEEAKKKIGTTKKEAESKKTVSGLQPVSEGNAPTTYEPKKFKEGKRANLGAKVMIDGKSYELTVADSDNLGMLAETYDSFQSLLDDFNNKKILLSPELGGIVKLAAEKGENIKEFIKDPDEFRKQNPEKFGKPKTESNIENLRNQVRKLAEELGTKLPANFDTFDEARLKKVIENGERIKQDRKKLETAKYKVGDKVTDPKGKEYEVTNSFISYEKSGSEVPVIYYELKGGKEKPFAQPERNLDTWKEMRGDEQPKVEQPKEEKKSGNRVFTDDAYERAKERLKNRHKNRLSINIDPEDLVDLLTMAGYHLEKGVRTFSDFCKKMIEDLGEWCKPYLKQTYQAAKYDEDIAKLNIDRKEWSSEDEVMSFDVLNFGKETKATPVEVAENTIKEHEIKKVAKKVATIKKPKKLESNDVPGRNVTENERLGEEEQQEVERPLNAGMAEGNTDNSADNTLGGRGNALRTPKQVLTGQNKNNYHEERGVETNVPTTPAQRRDANFDAIILANKLVAEGRQATPEEKKVLAKFTGWGGLGPQLGVIKEGMPRGYVPEEQRRAIERLLEKANGAGLTGKVLEDALLSASSSYYTPAQHIDALWDIAERMGFKGGKILEGSAGIGNILARIPSAMADASEIEAVEIDPSTGNILKLLYPDATTHIDGFEKVKVQPNSVDLAITNVPFVSDFKVSDPVNRDISKTFGNLHDFCIAKNVRSLKEGGIGIFISSNGTLDKSHRLREWVTNEGKSDFIGAFRLPNNTFKGTPVTTDIIVIRKRINGVKSPNAIDMLGTKVLRTVSYEKKDETYPTTTRNYDEYAPTSDKNHKKGQNVVKNIPLEVNSYFADHPEMMGGDMFVNAERGETYHPTSTGLFPREGFDLNKAIEKFVSGFKEEEQSALSKTPGAVLERTNAKNGTMSVDKKGNVVIARDGSLVKANVKNEVTGVDGTKYPVAEVVRNYDELRNTVQSLIDFQQNSDNDAELANYIKAANRVYDKFVGKYGNLNNNKRLKFLEDDVTFSSIKAIETKDKDEVSGEVTIGKSDILKKRVLNKFIIPEPKTPKDAVIASIFLNGGINSDYVAEKLGITKEQAEKAILKEGLAYRDPMTAEVVPTFQYLSGNVREKLKNVYSAAGYDKNGKEIDGKEVNHEFDKNAEDLRKVIPMTIPSNSIDFNAGSSWIPTRFYSDFIKDRFGVSTTPILNGNVWKVPDANSSSVLNRSKGVYSDKPGMNGFGYTGLELFNGAMNNRTFDFKVTRTVAGEKETYTDKEAAQRATGVVSEMKDDFKEWLRDRIANDADASAEIEEVYNDKFNAIVPMKIGTEYLPTYYPGANTGYPLYGHQKNAVMKCLLGSTLLSHEAGTGKTFTMVSTAMEMKRLGLAHKPVIVPLKATVGQFEGQARLLYPNARILSIPGGLTPAKRNNLLQQMRYNDWDIVLISDSVLKLIPDSEESRNAFINERIDEIQHLIDQAREAREATNKKGASDSSYNIGLNSAISDLTKQLEEEKSKLGAPKKDSKREAKSKANAKGKAELNIERKVDDIETWDKYGVDALFLDEAHTYKHLGFGTSMTRGIKGIDASVSEQAVSAYLKARDVMRRNNGKNFIMATGTPISNTAGEMYTFLKFMMPKDFLMENDIYYFDDFVRNFGEISIKPEFTTSGKFKAVSRFASYNNVPELMRVWTTICDTVIGTDSPEVREKLPKVINAKGEIKKGEDNPTDIFLKQSPTLIKIMRAIRTTLQEFEDMTPQEKKENSHIPVTMFGKASAAAIDPRLVWKKAKDEPNSKVNAAVKYILEDLKKTESYKGISVVFCEKHSRHDIVRDEFGEPVLDSKGKPKKTVGFNVFEDIKQKLIANGVPESQIAIITGNSMSENVKNEIFEKANRGEVRVVMGSARTVGTGVNIQRLAHLGIHLDVPVKPSDYEQENKRIIRQGNLHTIWDLPVEIVRFGVEDTLDVTGYQMLETKGKFVNSVRHVDKYFENSISDRTIEEEDESSFSHPVAMLSGSEFAAKKQIAEQDYRKFKNRKEQWDRQQIWYTNTLNVAKAKIKDKQKDIDKWNDAKKDLEGIFPNHKIETISINGVDCNTPEKLEETFKNINKELRQFDDEHRNAQGFNKQTLKYEMVVNGTKVDIDVVKERTIGFDPATHQMTGSMSTDITMHIPSINKGYNISGQYIKGAYDLINNELATGAYYDKWIKNAEDAIDESKATIEKFKDLEGKPFPDEDKLSKFEAILEEYQKGMELEMAEKEKKYAEEVGEEDSVTLEELLDSDDDEDEPDVDNEAMFGMEDDVRAIRDDESLIEYAQRLDRMNRSNEQIDAEERNQAINDLVESAQPDADDAVKGATKAVVQGLIDNIGGKDTHIVSNQEDLNALFNRKSEAMSFANSVAEFIKIRNKAVAQKGIVLAGLSNAEIKIVRGGGFGFEGKRPSEWAYENLVTEHDKSGKIKYDNNLPEMADGTRYSISKSAINKYLSGSSFHKGENGEYDVKAHIQLLPILKDVIKNSIDAEIHPDYNKVNETRNPENGYNERRLVHRLYGAANIDGTIYRVKTTMYEFMDRNEMNRPHSYEVTKIELLDNSNNSIPRGNEDSNTTSVTGANLLKNVEKSYDSGRKLLKESEENGYVQGVDSNIQATNTEAMRTKKGELYGFSKGKDVYLGPKGINPETPFHEYGHLWLRALQGGNKALWNHIKSLMEQVPKEISDFVKKNYPNLEGDALYREILTTYFGRKGRAKFEKDAREAINNGKNWKEKSFVADLFHQIRKALETAKKWIAKNILHVKPEDVKNIDDVFDKCYYDFANGFKPDGTDGETTEAMVSGTKSPVDELHDIQSRLFNLKENGEITELGRELVTFVRSKLTAGTGLRMGSMRINALVKDIVDATTKKQLEKPIREMQMMLGRANMESKLVATSKFLRTKGRKNNDRGVAVGTNVDADTNNILTAIRTMFNNPLKTIVDKELSDLRNSRNEKMKQAKELAGVEKFDDITGDMRLADPELDKLFSEVEKVREEIRTLEETQANWQTQNIMEELDSVNNAISELDTRLMDKAAKGEAITDEEARMHDTVLPLRKALAEVRSMLNKDIDETTGEGGLAQYEKLAKDKLKEALEIKPPFKRPANLTGTKWETEWRKYDALMAEHVLAQECAIAAQEKISEKLNEVNEQLFDLIEDGKSKWKMRQEAIREYKKNLVYNAVDEVQNKYLDDDPMRFNKDVLSLVKQGNAKEAVDILNKRMGDKWTRFHDLLIAPMYSLDFTLQMMTPNSRLGEGFLYEHFMKSPETGIVAANDRYYKDKKNTNRQIEDKFTELFGKSSEKVIKSWSKVDHEIKIIAASDDRNGRWKTGDERTISLNKDHALYLWAAWRQSDGKAKMQYEGFTDEDMQKIEDYLGEDAIKFGEWVTEELLPTLRDTKYNPTYRKLFGTDMARIDHYFPLSIDKTSIKPQDPKDKEHPKYMASLVVPNVIERTHNILPLDPTVLFTKVLSDYVDSQSHWVNVAPVIQDLNTLMASSTFSNRVESNHKGMMKIFRDAAYTATASAQKVDNSAADKLLLPLLAHAQVAAIAIKPYGALKQILSAPAVLAYSGDAQFYKEIGDLIGAFSPKWFSQAVNKYTPEIIEKHFGTIISPNNILAKYDWCLKNLPAFEERADRGDMGIEGLAYVDTWGKLSKSAKDIAIFMNQRVDLWTVAWMAKAVYDCEMRKNLALGDSQEVAHKKAVICAEIMYNQSQQSTRPEFSSYAQKHGNALEKSYTMFQSGPIGYARKTLSSANEFSHAEDQYKWDVKHGMDEKKAADKKARTQAHAIFTGIVFTAVLNGLWAAGGRPAMFVDPDDDDLKSIISNTVATSIFNGTYLAPMASSMAGGYEYHTFDILNERKKIVDMLKDDKKSGMAVALEVANALIKYNFSVDAKEVIEDIDWLLSESTYESFMIGEHLNADLALGVIRLTRMPKSQQARFAKVLYKQYGATEFAKAVNVIKRKDLNNYWVDSYAKDYVQMNFGKDFLEDMKEYPKYLKRLNSGTLTEDDARFFNFPDAAYKDYDMAMQSLRANIREQNPEGAFFGRKKNIAFGDMYARSIIEKVYKEWQRVNEK